MTGTKSSFMYFGWTEEWTVNLDSVRPLRWVGNIRTDRETILTHQKMSLIGSGSIPVPLPGRLWRTTRSHQKMAGGTSELLITTKGN